MDWLTTQDNDLGWWMLSRTMNIFDELESPVFMHVTTVVHPVLISFRETVSPFFFSSRFLLIHLLLTELSALINFSLYHIHFLLCANFVCPTLQLKVLNVAFWKFYFLYESFLYELIQSINNRKNNRLYCILCINYNYNQIHNYN